MARRETGIRERVARALMVSAAIYAVAIGVWAVQTRQQSEASPTSAATTITFDDRAAGEIAGSTYAGQGVEVSSPDGGGAGATLFVPASASCPSYAAPTPPNMLIAKPGSYAPLTVKFTEGRVSDQVSFTVGNAGNAEVVIEAFDTSGQSVTTKTVAAPGPGQCANTPVTLSGTSGIAELRLRKNGSGTADGYGIDSLSFSPLRSASGTPGDFTVAPTTGTAPLTVTATYTPAVAVVPPAPKTTVNFDDLDDNSFVTNQYSAKHGLTISGTDSGRPIVYGPLHAPKFCSGGTEASSQPHYLAPRIGDLPTYGGAVFTFAQPVKNPGVTLVSVGRSTVTVTYAKADGTTIESKTIGPGSSDPSGKCQQNPTSYQGTELVSKITVQSNEAAGGEDGYGIDDLVWVSGTSAPPAAEPLTWNFGDGTVVTNGPTTQAHTYKTAGTYAVTLKRGNTLVGTRSVTVTELTAPTVAATFTTSKSTYESGEKVEFTLKNTGSTALQLANGAPFKIMQGSTTIFSPIATQAIETLAVGQSKGWSWNQKDTSEKQVAGGAYVVTVDFAAEGQSYSRSAAFTIAPAVTTTTTKPPVISFSVTPTNGTIPLTVTLTCTGDTLRDVVADWGDGGVTSGITCPTTLTHTYTQKGTYTVTLRQGTTILGTQQVTANAVVANTAGQSDGKGAPAALASTGSNLILLLIIATLLAGLFSYLTIRRPFHT